MEKESVPSVRPGHLFEAGGESQKPLRDMAALHFVLQNGKCVTLHQPFKNGSTVDIREGITLIRGCLGHQPSLVQAPFGHWDICDTIFIRK